MTMIIMRRHFNSIKRSWQQKGQVKLAKKLFCKPVKLSFGYLPNTDVNLEILVKENSRKVLK